MLLSIIFQIYWNSKTDERGLSRKHILECVKASLARLNLEYIDIIILHKADPMCPMEGKQPFHILRKRRLLMRFRVHYLPILKLC